MTTALVTGAAGFIASHLAENLRRTKVDRIVGVDLRQIRSELFDVALVEDLSDASAVKRTIQSERPDLVFHLAGTTTGSDDAVFESNFETTRHLINGMRDAAPSSRIVLLGSAAEYGEVPIDQQPVRESFQGHAVTAYGRAKAKVSALAFEAAVTHGTEVVVARPFNVVGAGISAGLMVGAVIERLRKALADPPPRRLRVGRTTAVRDFVSVTDVARGLSLAAERGVPGEAYNFCSGVGHSVAYVLQRLIALAGTSVDIEVDSTLMRHGDVDSLIGSWDKAALELGWAPQVPLEDSLVAAWNAAFPQNEIPAR